MDTVTSPLRFNPKPYTIDSDLMNLPWYTELSDTMFLLGKIREAQKHQMKHGKKEELKCV